MKNLLARTSLSTALLGVVAVALGVLIVMRLAVGTRTADLLATAPRKPNLPEMKLDAPAIDTHLEPVRDHALFYSSRAFYVAPPPPAAPAAPPRPSYVLAGTFVIPHKHTVALLKQSTSGSVMKVKAGDDLEGWHIESVEGARVVLRYEDERFEIARAGVRDSVSHMTRAPLTRAARPTVITASATPTAAAGATPTAADATPASAPATPTTSSASPTPTVKSLGNGRSGAPIRDAALRTGQASTEARLYRPPQ